MAEQLGEAVLRITIDDDAARDQLRALRQEIEGTTGTARSTRSRRSTSSSGGLSGLEGGPTIDRDAVRRFNLRGLNAALESIAEDIDSIRTARQVNIGSSWTKALEFLQENKENIDSISASKNLNLRSSWNTALALLSETKEDIDSISASKNLNIRSSWNTALALLSETKEDIDSISASKKLNLRSSWSGFLSELNETKTDIDSAATAKKINIRASWTKFLGQLEEVAQDLNSLRRSPATQQQINASLERQAGVRSLQTAGGGGGGLTSFLREVRQREEGERKIAAVRKAGYKDAEFAEKTLRSFVEQRAKRESGAGADARKRAGGAVGSALIGGGFPLLFGQGVGAAAGGAVGGAVGGAIGGQFGFGLSIVGTIVGDAFDEALNKGKTLAAGLSDPIGKFEELRQAGLLSSKALEKNVASLIAQGRNAEAAAQIQLDLVNNFGDTSQLTALNTAYDELGRAFSQLSVITAKFVAGPLADFITKLSGAFTAQSTQALLNERLAGAPEAARTEILAARRAAFKEASQAGTPGGGAITAGNLAGLAAADKLLGKTKEQQRIEAARALAITRENSLRSVSFRQVDAQVQGYERLNLELEKQRINEQRIQDLSVDGADPDKINREAAQATYRVQSQINDLAKERLATTNLDAAQNQLALQAVQQRIAAATQLAGVEQGIVRSTLEQALNIQAGVAEAKRREQELGAQIDAARLRGGDAGEAEASRLVGQQQVAAEETKLRLIEGATALRDAGVQLRKDLDAAFLNLQRLRTGGGGLNQFLGGQDRARREQDVFKALLPQLRQAQGTFTQLTGARAPEFSGSTASVNQSILQFIDAVKTEEQALTNTVDSQRALSENTAALAQITGELRTTIAELNAKDWNVSVNVAANGTSQATGDVVNNFLSVPQ